MQLKLDQLGDALKRKLLPIYLICGDDPLLLEEACDSVVAAAKTAGFTEREILFAESGFKWAALNQSAHSMSLFAERKIIDLRVPNGKFDREASEVLRAYVEHLHEDNLLLIRSPRLDKRQRSSAWFKALDAVGGTLMIWDLSQREFDGWLSSRLRREGLQLEAGAVKALKFRVEGNLLAAAQEIQKLKLMQLAQPIGLDELNQALADSSQFDVFELIDAVFAGSARRVARMLRNFKQEGLSPFALLAPFTYQIRQLNGGGGWMPTQRARAAQSFVARVGPLEAVLADCALIDQQAKGQRLGDAWLTLEAMLLTLCESRSGVLPAVSELAPPHHA